MRIEYEASPAVREAIESLGRTEDLRLSPNQRRLAVARFTLDGIAIVGVEIAASSNGPRVELTSVTTLSSPALQRPHGVDFVDDDTLIVANRKGGVTILELPAEAPGVRSFEVTPKRAWASGEIELVSSPGSLAVAGVNGGRCEVIVCNNYVHTVTRHELDLAAGCALAESGVLLRRGLSIPDGVAVSRDGQWLAVSNHESQAVMLYRRARRLDEHSQPDGVLRGIGFPHGLRFSADGRRIVVADAGAPNVLIFSAADGDWCGVRWPDATVRVMDDEAFQRGRYNVEEGGPKGIDLAADGRVLVATAEFLSLAFFDLPALIAGAGGAAPGRAEDGGAPGGPDEPSPEVRRELKLMEAEVRAYRAEQELGRVTGSVSWRLTAPIRRMRSPVRDALSRARELRSRVR